MAIGMGELFKLLNEPKNILTVIPWALGYGGALRNEFADCFPKKRRLRFKRRTILASTLYERDDALTVKCAPGQRGVTDNEATDAYVGGAAKRMVAGRGSRLSTG